LVLRLSTTTVSIHAPRAGCDAASSAQNPPACSFNPRTPRGVRRDFIVKFGTQKLVSIHAPRAGCDFGVTSRFTTRARFNPRTPRGVRPSTRPSSAIDSSCFNPRTPRGVRQVASSSGNGEHLFQSTHPARGATTRSGTVSCTAPVSIHAPRAGCDPRRRGRSCVGRRFNPRTPRGVRPLDMCAEVRRQKVSIHAPRAGCDRFRSAFP